MKLLAARYDKQGSRFRATGDNARAIEAFRKAIQQSSDWDTPWYNLGLTYKYMNKWPESYRCNAEAVRLDPKNKAAIWNMGIAATALEDWSEARRAWHLCDIEVPDGAGPPDMNLGSVPIRINPNSDGEVVWARRIDPARALLTSIPLPESGHRHGDLVLHDGAPVGYRKSNGRDVPVFNELEILAPSTEGTFEVTLTANNIDDLVAFEKSCEQAGCASEDWSTMRVLCRACSEGSAHEHPEPEIQGAHRFAVAAQSLEAVERAVSAWLVSAKHVSARDIVAHIPPVVRQ